MCWKKNYQESFIFLKFLFSWHYSKRCLKWMLRQQIKSFKFTCKLNRNRLNIWGKTHQNIKHAYFIVIYIYKKLYPDRFINAQMKLLQLESWTVGYIFIIPNRDPLRKDFSLIQPPQRLEGMPKILGCFTISQQQF